MMFVAPRSGCCLFEIVQVSILNFILLVSLYMISLMVFCWFFFTDFTIRFMTAANNTTDNIHLLYTLVSIMM